jgi:hypothetical protein
MPAAHVRASQMSGPGVPAVSSERMVSMIGVIGWFSIGTLERCAAATLRASLTICSHSVK